MNSIRAFEVAARHLNFSRAAEEIGVTPGAISKQILLLEDFIGSKLFERLPGGLSLTREGHSLRDSVVPAFDMLSSAFARYSRRKPRSNVCRISTLASFAAEFFVPRLDKFAEDLPHIELEILTSDRLIDFDREEIDLGVRYGPGGWDDVVSSELIKGELVPVCCPDIFAQRGDMDLENFIQSTRRIQLFSNDEWRVWADQTDIDISGAPDVFIVEDFLVAIAAAMTGQGLALVPEVLARRLVKSGKLAVFSADRLPWNQTYYITHAPGGETRPMVKEVISWLRAEATKA